MAGALQAGETRPRPVLRRYPEGAGDGSLVRRLLAGRLLEGEEVGGGDLPARSILVCRIGEFPWKVYRVHLGTGARKLLREIVPADRAAILGRRLLTSADGRSWAHTVAQKLSVLYLVEGSR